jgi:acetyl-CoA acetyltransferase
MAGMKAPRVAVVGVGVTAFAPQIPGKTIYGLALEACMAAIADAGLTRNDIDGILVTPTGRFRDVRIGYALGEHLGIHHRYLSGHNNIGAGGAAFSLDIARWSLQEDHTRYVLLVDAANWSLPLEYESYTMEGQADWSSGPPLHVTNDQAWGGNWVQQQAAVAARHAHEFGTTPEQLAAVAAAARHNASLNPEAVYREKLSIDDVLSSPVVTSPLHEPMCSMLNDGGAAVVLTTEERAVDLPKQPVYMLGGGSCFTGPWLVHAAYDDLTGTYDMVRTVGRSAADQAFAEAGLTRSEVDVVQVSDPSAISAIIALEDYGFCGKGEGGPFVGDGQRIGVGGDLPVNTHGGWLSGTFAGASHATLVEAVRQLRGDCGDRQVPDAEVALFGSVGGAASNHSVTLLGRN